MLCVLSIAGAASPIPVWADSGEKVSVATGPARIGKAPAALERYIERAVQDWGVPGMAMAIIKDDEIVFARGFGVRNSETREPATAQTVFGIGSVTKSVTATAIAMLVDDGKLTWDTPVKDYVPEFETYDPYVTSQLSLRDIAAHRTGIEDANYLQRRPTHRAENIHHPTRADIVRAFKHLRPSDSFRNSFAYKNVTWVPAGAAIEAAAGMSWDQFVHERIFAPLGMSRSSTSVNETDVLQDVSSAHVFVQGKLAPIPLVNADVPGPMGSVNASVVDLAQYVRFHMGDGTFEGKRLLRKDSLAELHRPHVVDAGETFTSGTPFTKQVSYSLGWWVQDYRGYKLVRHAGAVVGGNANVFYIPEKKIGVVLLANGGSMSMLAAAALRTLDTYLDVPLYDWYARVVEAEPARLKKPLSPAFEAAMAERAKTRIQGTRPSLDLSRYAGVYRNPVYGDLHFIREGDKLTARLWTFTGELAHWNYDTFSLNWDERHHYLHVGPEMQNLVRFDLDERGELSKVSFLGLGIFERLPDSPSAGASGD